MEFTEFQIGKMCEANHGFCYDATPSTWPDKSERRQMEELVKSGLMEKLKNFTGDKNGFYALTEEGKQVIE